MKKILLIGNSDSIFIKSYIEHVILGGEYKIYLGHRNNPSNHLDFYKKNKIALISYNASVPFLSKVPIIRGLLNRLRRSAISKRNYDIIHIHQIFPHAISFAQLLAPNYEKSYIVGTFWGSDLLLASAETREEIRQYLKKFHIISVQSDLMEARFVNDYGEYQYKLRRAHLGIEYLSVISDMLKLHSKQDCRTRFGITSDKVAICIGYSGCERHQHLRVIAQISKIPDNILQKIVWVFQITYGGTVEYKNSIHEELKQSKLDYKVLLDYMNDEDVAKLRIAADIYINSVTSDAASASVTEYLYAGTTLLNPIWNKYSLLEKAEVDFIEYSNLDEIPEIIEKLVKTGITPNVEQREKMHELFSWENTRDLWLNLYRNGEQ